MKINTYCIGFVGFGHMGKILCRMIEHAKLIPRSQIFFVRRDPRKIREDEREFGITATTLETLFSHCDIIFLCIRPAQAEEVLKSIAALEARGKMFLSLLAGARIAYFEKFLGPIPLIRAMPNLASEVGEGMTVLAPSPHANAEFKSFVHLLFASMGSIIELPEEVMDSATSMAGSGPAFVFTLIEAMARFGEKEGISYEKSLKMAAQIFLGSACLLLKSDVGIEERILQISVPHGTTEAGLKILGEKEIGKHFQAAMDAAAMRSKMISQEMK